MRAGELSDVALFMQGFDRCPGSITGAMPWKVCPRMSRRMAFGPAGLYALILSLSACSPSATAQQPATKTLTEADARAQFAQQDAARAQAKAGTHERAQAAEQASNLAFVIAWNEFDAAHYDEAAAWFARRDALSTEHYRNEITFQQTVKKAEYDASQAKLETAFVSWRARLAAETDPQKKLAMQNVVDGIPAMRYALPSSFIAEMETLAQGAGDSALELKYDQQDLTLAQAQLKDMVEAGLPTDKTDEQRARVASSTARVGGTYEKKDDFANARKCYDTALALRQALPPELPTRDLEAAYSDLGGLYRHMGELPAARDQYLRSLQALQDSEPTYQKALTAPPPPEYNGLDAKTVEGYMTERRQGAIVERAMSQALVLNNIGIIAAELGDFKASAAYYQQSLQSLDAVPAGGIFDIYKALIRTKTQANIATLHADSGQIDQALSEENQVIQAKRALGESAATELNNAASWYQEKGDPQTARAYLRQAQQSYQTSHDLRGVVAATLALASLAYEAGRYDESEAGARQALAFAQETGDLGWQGAATRQLAAVAWKTNHLEAADALLVRAETIDKQVGAPLDAEYTFDLEGRVRESRGDLSGALTRFQSAIKLIEDVRNTTTSPADFSNKKDTYRAYERIVRLLIKMGRPDDAFDYFNRSQSKQLQDLLNASAAKTGDPALQALLDRKKALLVQRGANAAQLQAEQSKPAAQRDQNAINNLKSALIATDKEYGLVVATLKKDHRSNYDKVFAIDPVSLRLMQRKLPLGVAVVEYAPLGDQLYLFLVTRETLKIYAPAVNLPDLWKRVTETCRQLATPQSAFTRGGQRAGRAVENEDGAPTDGRPLDDNLTTLYETLIAPVEADLAAKTTVAFVPTGLLSYLPMQALAKRGADGHLHYLIEDKQIAYLAGVDVVAMLSPRSAADEGAGILALGDPTGANLPGALAEVQAVGKVYPLSQVLSGDQATKSFVVDDKNLNRRILHFATHGILNAQDPLNSYILLAKDNTPGDEQLTFGEIVGLHMDKVDIVTLSACQTALAETNPEGHDLQTLATSFISAGAQSVVASLWSVSDDSTKDLMVAFYQNLAKGQTKAAALRAAELQVMHDPKYAHPYYWAPFILMGNWN